MYERYYSTCQEMCRGLGTVRECRGGEGQGRERESETEIRRKRGGGAKIKEVRQRETLRRESEEDGNEERRREDWGEQRRLDHFSQGGTDPQLIIPSYLHLSVPSLTLCI